MRARSAICLTVGALLAGGVAASAFPGATKSRWIAADLGTLGAPSSTRAYDINNRGQVVGVSTTSAGAVRGFVWENGAMKALGTGRYAAAWAINDRGQVVGISEGHAMLWDQGRARRIGGSSSVALALNDGGDVLVQEPSGAFLWHDGRRLDLGSSATSYPTGLNNVGQVVGVTRITDEPEGSHVTLWIGGKPRDLGQGWPADITESGWIVGNRLVAGELHATLWRNGQVIDLGTLPDSKSSVALRANNRGQVLGRSDERAFLWEAGVMTDLGSPGGNPQFPMALSERGQVVLTMKAANRNMHAFLWQHGVLTDLGTLPRIRSIRAMGINDRNQVLGNTRMPDLRSGPPPRAVVWTLRS